MRAKSDDRSPPDIKELRRIARLEVAKRLTVSSNHAINDLAQSAVAEYLGAAAKEEVDVPGALIRIIARRLGIKYRDEWEKKRPNLPIDHHGLADDDGRGRVFEPPSGEVPASVALANEARRKRIAEAVERLDPVDREIVQLTYLGDPPRKAPDVARSLGLKPGTVRNRLVGIRRTLADLLEDELG